MVSNKITSPHFNINMLANNRILNKAAYILGLTLVLLACKQKNNEDKKNVPVKQDVVIAPIKTPALSAIGNKIYGDFDGDGKADLATAIKIKEGKGNPIEDGTADEYKIQFSGTQLTALNTGCCEIRLINEGDLNNDGADDLSIYQAPMNGCTYSITTYSFTNGVWKQIIETFLIPTACNYLSDADLQKRVFKENDIVYYYNTDQNDENGKLIKKRVTIK